MATEENPAVTHFREYLRIKTVQPDPDYAGAVSWLRIRGEAAGGHVTVVESAPGRPVVIVSFPGTQHKLKSLLLNSHMDVVPVFPEHWTYPPFSAHKDAEGNIWARGSQDMKCVGVQYLEAMARLKEQGKQFLRTVHLSFVPDEEIGGTLGMKEFVKMKEFLDLNVGFALDEGYANPNEEFSLFYGERSVCAVMVHCSGQPGHGSQFLPNTAAGKLQRVLDSFLSFRSEEEARMHQEQLQLGDVTTVNLTMLQGGVQMNVVPAVLSAGFDIRVAPTVDLVEFKKRMCGWCEEAGPGVTIEFKRKVMNPKVTCVEDGKCSWWDTFAGACRVQNVRLVKSIFPAATDCRYLREMDIPALGFSPMNNTPILLHDNNEFLNEKIFLRGIDIYCTVIAALADKPE